MPQCRWPSAAGHLPQPASQLCNCLIQKATCRRNSRPLLPGLPTQALLHSSNHCPCPAAVPDAIGAGPPPSHAQAGCKAGWVHPPVPRNIHAVQPSKCQVGGVASAHICKRNKGMWASCVGGHMGNEGNAAGATTERHQLQRRGSSSRGSRLHRRDSKELQRGMHGVNARRPAAWQE